MRFKRKAVVTVVAVLGALVMFAIVLFRESGGPRYKGKSLLQWIASYEPEVLPLYRFEVRTDISREDVQAVRAIGTNALPSLLHWIDYEPPDRTAKQAVLRTLERLPSFLFPDRFRRAKFWNDSAEVRSRRAMIGFKMLGPIGAPAIPELTRLSCVSTGDMTCFRAIVSLVSIGSTALPALKKVIESTNTAAISPFFAATAFDESGTNAVLMLKDCLENRNPYIAFTAAHYLARRKAEPTVVLRRLTKFMEYPDRHIRADAIEYAAEYGDLARTIIPELVKALEDQDSTVRNEATNALKIIAPEILTNTVAN